MTQFHEAITKALQTADLLRQDLQEANAAAERNLFSMIILPEIERLAAIEAKLKMIAKDLDHEPLTITIEGGCLRDVTGIPDGWMYEVIDLDLDECSETEADRILLGK